MPKLAKTIRMVAPGDVYPSVFEAGEEVDGRVAEVAEQLGALEKPVKKAMKSPENKGA